ncbi:MAG: response regulator transcription factor [Eubacterium sp.]
MKNKILIVDDEKDIVSLLRDYFELNGYEVMTAGGGNEAIKRAEDLPDIILLDINMPDRDGLSVCQRIRDFVACPILFLTARVEDSDKVKGFAIGGDDYIIKPFSLDELGARVAAHLRRETRKRQASRVWFDNELVIDYTEHQVYLKNRPIRFAKKEFDIIELLSQNAGQVFDKERIYERVWGLEGTGDNTVVAEHIRRIRAKFSAFGRADTIETVWGVGYKWRK